MRVKREHIKKFSSLPLWWQLVSGLFLCFFCSAVVTAACLFLDMKEVSKNNWSYLREINEQGKQRSRLLQPMWTGSVTYIWSTIG